MYLEFHTKKEDYIKIIKAKNKHSRLFTEKDFIYYKNWFWFKMSNKFRFLEINNYSELYNYSDYMAVRDVNQKEKIKTFIQWIDEKKISYNFRYLHSPNVPPASFLNSINFVSPIKID